jgi:hypothetical protein
VPATKVELHHGHESRNRIVDFGNRKQHLGVTHEAARFWLALGIIFLPQDTISGSG